VLVGSEVLDLSLNCPSYHELLLWLSWTSLNPRGLSLDCVKVSQPFFAVVTVCEATRGLLSPGCQCDRVPLLLLPLSSGFLFVVPNYMYIYSLLSMFVGIFLSRGFSTCCSSCWYLLWLKGFDCYSLLQFSFRQPLNVYIFLYL